MLIASLSCSQQKLQFFFLCKTDFLALLCNLVNRLSSRLPHSFICLLCFGSEKSPSGLPYPLSIALVLIGCGLVFSLIAFVKGGPSSILAAVAKSGFTAAFSLIFVSEIGDKVTFSFHRNSVCIKPEMFSILSRF